MSSDLLDINLKNFINPALKITYTVNNSNINASIDDSIVDGLRDSHKNGRKNVAEMAIGASFIRPDIVPSNSTPNEKFELEPPALVIAWFSYASLYLFILLERSFTANCPNSSPYLFNAFVNPHILPKINAGASKYFKAILFTFCTFLRMINNIKNGTYEIRMYTFKMMSR